MLHLATVLNLGIIPITFGVLSLYTAKSLVPIHMFNLVSILLMSIRSIVNEIFENGVLTDVQEEEILSLIKVKEFDEDDALAIDHLMEGLASGRIRRVF